MSDSTILTVRAEENAQQIVLHEDKQHYPSAHEVYPEAEILIEEEDTQPLEQPIIAPVKTKLYEAVEREMPQTTFSFEYLTGLMDHPTLIRNVALLGYAIRMTSMGAEQ
jgi:U5 small nuclear ribonucleoprotein component